MSVIVTLHIYSGVPDPAWELSDAQAKELSDRIREIENTTLQKPSGLHGGLGYRGFSITSVGEKLLDAHVYVHDGIVDLDRFDLNRATNSTELEIWLLSTGADSVPDDVREYVKAQLTTGPNLMSPQGLILAVPPYNPGKWNNDPNIRTRNNCYNYANDKITNTFAQPGLGSGLQYSAFDCGNVGAASQRDRQVPTGAPSTTPAQGHFIALVIWPGRDFHWYRLDSNAMWSHKPGQTPARNTDNSGRTISDPRSCDRGPYTNFCQFFHCIPSNTNIR